MRKLLVLFLLVLAGCGTAAPARYQYNTQCPGYPHQVVMQGQCVDVTPTPIKVTWPTP